MAYLNVRERRIEAKIAYVGSELAGKATNFDQLKLATNDVRIGKIESSTSDAGDTLSLAWLPPESRFRDCDVFVKIIAQRGGVSAERFAEVLREVDGIVVVVDAHPSAQERNLASLTAVRSVMARAETRNVPIVIQVNKTDLSDALGADDVVDALHANDFTHVIAAAARGEGVIETLEAALNEVLTSMQTDLEQQADGTPPTVRPNGTSANGNFVSDGGHPLLAALRQVLRETVREHVEELEARVTKRIVDSLARIESRLEASEQATADVARQVDELARTRRDDTLAVQVLSVLRETDESLQGLVGAVAACGSKEDLTAVSTRLDRVRDELKGEMVRTLEARSRADREYLATATSTLKKSVDAMSSEMRTFDVRARVGEAIELVTVVEGRTELLASGLAATVSAVHAVTPRLEQIELAVKRTAKLDDSVRGMRTELSDGFGATAEKTEAVHARVNEIVEELKKPKKGWFT